MLIIAHRWALSAQWRALSAHEMALTAQTCALSAKHWAESVQVAHFTDLWAEFFR
jgi:hypothetical protein